MPEFENYTPRTPEEERKLMESLGFTPEWQATQLKDMAKRYGLNWDEITKKLTPAQMTSGKYSFGGQNSSYDKDSGWTTTGENTYGLDMGAQGPGMSNHGASYDKDGNFLGLYGGGKESDVGQQGMYLKMAAAAAAPFAAGALAGTLPEAMGAISSP